MKVLILKCSSCGGNLEIAPDIDTFACSYCGAQQTVERRGGIISLKLVTDAIGRVQSGTDKAAAELALVRMKEELNALNDSYRKRVQQATNQRNNAITLPIVGIAILTLVICCAVSNELHGGGMLIVLAMGGVGIFLAERALSRPIREALARDSAQFVQRVKDLQQRIAVKKAIADGD